MNAPNRKPTDFHINPDWATLPLFEHKGWKRLPFEAFAESVNERVEPANAADEIYVGLDDLDSGNLHIRRWGKGSDVIGTKLRFRKGDIIFGRRRAYQRKLAVAEFDGICSAHAMVVRAKQDMVLPEFLPFLMMSDRFMQRAVEISVGSLSPTINWTTLKLEEFDLPPLEQQREIAEILQAGNCTASRYLSLATNFSRWHALNRDATVSGSFLNDPHNDIKRSSSSGWDNLRIQDLVQFIGGAQPPRDTFEYSPSPGNIRFIQIRDYKSDDFLVYIRKELAKRFCDIDDVMIGRYGPPIFQILRGIKGSYNVALIKAQPKDELRLSKNYLYHFLKQDRLFELIDHLSQRSSGQTGVDMEALNNYPMPLPPIEVQLQLAKEFNQRETQLQQIEQHVERVRMLLNQWIN